jgi:hypothetical protein
MTATIVYTERIFRRAILHYLWRAYLKRLLAPSIVGVALLVVAFCLDSPRLEASAVMLVLVIPAMMALGYWLRIRESLRRFRMLDHGRMIMAVSDAGVAIESALGKSETPWKIYGELWEFPTEHLLFYHGAQFITLPRDQVAPEFITYIRAHLPEKSASPLG